MAASQPSPAPLNYTSADIVAETDSEITLRIGDYRGIQLTQTYNKERGWGDGEPASIVITDQNRQLVIYVQPLYLP